MTLTMRATLAVAQRSAVISDCQRFRYRLSRRWGEGPALVFIMLNPSTADASVDDATIRRCVGFAAREGWGAIDVVNLFAYRATDPKDLRRAGYPIGPDNDNAITEAVTSAGCVCLAWGANAGELARPGEVLALLRRLGIDLHCLRITRSGHPQHPLMLPSDCTLRPFTLQAIDDAIHGGAA